MAKQTTWALKLTPEEAAKYRTMREEIESEKPEIIAEVQWARRATPIYVLKMETAGRIGPTEMTVRIRRNQATDNDEEQLEVDSVTGTVAGEPAVLEENVHFMWRTLADERYYLDTGGLDNIEIS